MNIHTAFSGDEAIDKLKKNKIDIVLMDIMMPGKNGYDTMKEIRAEEQYKELPIIAVTAKAMKGDKELCIDAGANDYLTKPINTELLIRKMKKQLNIKTIKNEKFKNNCNCIISNFWNNCCYCSNKKNQC